MNNKILVADLDRTLLCDDKSISEKENLQNKLDKYLFLLVLIRNLVLHMDFFEVFQ